LKLSLHTSPQQSLSLVHGAPASRQAQVLSDSQRLSQQSPSVLHDSLGPEQLEAQRLKAASQLPLQHTASPLSLSSQNPPTGTQSALEQTSSLAPDAPTQKPPQHWLALVQMDPSAAHCGSVHRLSSQYWLQHSSFTVQSLPSGAHTTSLQLPARQISVQHSKSSSQSSPANLHWNPPQDSLIQLLLQQSTLPPQALPSCTQQLSLQLLTPVENPQHCSVWAHPNPVAPQTGFWSKHL